MASYNFKWKHPGAQDVWILVKFEKWSKSEKLMRSGDIFEKTVAIPTVPTASDKLYYKFWVDGTWTCDDAAPVETLIDDNRHNFITGGQVLQYLSTLADLVGQGRDDQQARPKRAPMYRRLDFDTQEIRLLKLHPLPAVVYTSEDFGIKCSLEYASMIDPGPYVALSYCWGDPSITRSIQVEDRAVDVTTNLYSALLAVRKSRTQTGSKNPIRLWVDALCINQKDNEERSHQVGNMRQIYSRAEEVICWVGGRGDKSAADLERLIKNQVNTKAVSWTDDNCLIIRNFFSQPYWNRVWVIQEIAVASKVKVLYGEIEMLWDDVAAVLTLLKEDTKSIARYYEPVFLSCVHLLEFRNRFLVSTRSISLFDAMRWSTKTLATDPRDKIFALLGLCHDGPRIVPVPNYKQSLEEIITGMSREMMSLTRSLDLICLKGTAPPYEEKLQLPTWVPNWSNLWPNTVTALESNFSEWRSRFDSNPVVIDSSTRFLTVTGKYFLGTITSLTSPMTSYGEPLQNSNIRAPWILSTTNLNTLNAFLQSPTANQLTTRDNIWKHLTMSLLPETFTDSVAMSCFSTIWTPEGRGAVHNLALIHWIDQNAWFKVNDWTLREWSQVWGLRNKRSWGTVFQKTITDALTVSSPVREYHTVRELETFIETLEVVLGSGMRLAVLKNGTPKTSPQPLAMVHPGAQESDEIYCLNGCSIAVILRPVLGSDGVKRYKVIGGADYTTKWITQEKENPKSTSPVGVEDYKGPEIILC